MRRYSIRINDTVHTLDVEETARNCYVVTLEDGSLVDVVMENDQDLAQATITPAIAGASRPAITPTVRPAVRAATPPRAAAVSAVPTGGSGATGTLTAPMPGVVLSIAVAPGTAVTRGQTLLVLEAMKMKNEIKAQRDGVVAEVFVKAGDQVKHADPLLAFEG